MEARVTGLAVSPERFLLLWLPAVFLHLLPLVSPPPHHLPSFSFNFPGFLLQESVPSGPQLVLWAFVLNG